MFSSGCCQSFTDQCSSFCTWVLNESPFPSLAILKKEKSSLPCCVGGGGTHPICSPVPHWSPLGTTWALLEKVQVEEWHRLSGKLLGTQRNLICFLGSLLSYPLIGGIGKETILESDKEIKYLKGYSLKIHVRGEMLQRMGKKWPRMSLPSLD